MYFLSKQESGSLFAIFYIHVFTVGNVVSANLLASFSYVLMETDWKIEHSLNDREKEAN